MTDHATRQILAQLAEQDAAIAALRAKVAARRPRRRARSHGPLLLLALLMALAPLSALAVNFSDLGQFSPSHAANIQAIADTGITVGFDDPASADPDVRLYNPKGNVTREEMATFLAKTAGLGNNPPVANAKTAQTAQTAATATNATNATNAANAQDAAQLGGQPASAYVRGGSSPTFADLTATGEIRDSFATGTTNRATPLAYAYIRSAGVVAAGTPNLSAAYNATLKRYEITIAGEDYDYETFPTFISLNAPPNRFASTGDINGQLVVFVQDGAANLLQADFQIVIFKP